MKIRTLVMSGTMAFSLIAALPAAALPAAAVPAAAQGHDWGGAQFSYASAASPQDWGRDRNDRRFDGQRFDDRRGNFEEAAFRNGLRDGYDKGRDDARHRRYPDVNRQRWFRNGDHDYNSRYGPRDVYRQDYRRGFEQGYRRAFDEFRR